MHENDVLSSLSSALAPVEERLAPNANQMLYQHRALKETVTEANKLKNIALRYLARREYTASGLSQKLETRAASPLVKQVILHLTEEGWLSDARFAKLYVHSHAVRYGTQYLRAALAARGVSAELIEEALHSEDIADEMERAKALYVRKYPSLAVDANERTRRYRYLLRRGFSSSVARSLCKD